MRDIWYCFVPENTDFADKMGDWGLSGIKRINLWLFAVKIRNEKKCMSYREVIAMDFCYNRSVEIKRKKGFYDSDETKGD